jgi:hypothetical protein
MEWQSLIAFDNKWKIFNTFLDHNQHMVCVIDQYIEGTDGCNLSIHIVIFSYSILKE